MSSTGEGTRVSNLEEEPPERRKPASFSSTFSTYVTLLGYTIGMSDIWRFPFLVHKNGGGAFFIPFILTIFLCGIPLFFLEYTISNFSGKGPYLIWDMCPIFRGVGATLAVAYVLYMAWSSIFRGWLAVFLTYSFRDPLPWTHCGNEWNTLVCRPNQFTKTLPVSDSVITFTGNITTTNPSTFGYSHNLSSEKFMTAAEEFWQYEALKLSDGLTHLDGIQWRLVLFIAILRVLVYLCASKSIASIEKVMYVLLFAPILFLISVFIQSLTLPGAAAGLYKFFYPDFSRLADARIWIESFLMVFYTMAFGWGAILTVGSHSNFRDNCVRTSILLPLLDATVGIVNGAVCFSVLGNMAHAHGVEVDQVLTTGFAAGIVSYVTSLSSFPVPQIWNFAFFVTAIMAGLDSQIVPIEMVIQVIGEAFPGLYPRHRLSVLGAVSVLLFILALPTCTGAGGYMFLWCDWFVGVWSGPICAFVEVIVVAWIYGMDRFDSDVLIMTGRKLPAYFRITIAFVAPTLLLIIFLTSCVEYVPPKYGDYSYPSWARGLGWTVVAVILSPIILKALVDLLRKKGSFGQRIKSSIEEKTCWGPKDQTVLEEYMCNKKAYKERTFVNLLRYTVLGSSTKTSCKMTQHELIHLNECTNT